MTCIEINKEEEGWDQGVGCIPPTADQGVGGSSVKTYFSFIRWQRILLHKRFLLVVLKHLSSKIRCQKMNEKLPSLD